GITDNAVAATARTAVPLVVLRRPGWTARAGDDWTRVASMPEAGCAVAIAGPGAVFVTTGRRDLDAFAADDRHEFVVRAVEPPSGATPPRMTLLLDRGPYTLDGERSLMLAHHVTLLVTKDSGGASTIAKLDAARELGVPVIMVDRPPVPAGVDAVAGVEEVLAPLGLG